MRGDVAAGFGVYAFKDKEAAVLHAQGSLRGHWGWDNWKGCPVPRTADGSIEIWGEVVEHTMGYRAQFARIASIDAIYPQDHELLAALRAKYGV